MKVPWETIGKIGVALLVVSFGLSLCVFGFYRVIRGKPEESVNEVQNGPFKVLVRHQEFHHSGTVVTDICLAETSSHTFPTKQLQCILNGYDFEGLSVTWVGKREIEISFSSGRITNFTNEALVYAAGSPIPVGFHAILRDENKQYPRE